VASNGASKGVKKGKTKTRKKKTKKEVTAWPAVASTCGYLLSELLLSTIPQKFLFRCKLLRFPFLFWEILTSANVSVCL